MDMTTTDVGTRISGTQRVEMVAGQHLKMETSPGGEELLDEVVPAGKAWSALVIVVITERDA